MFFKVCSRCFLVGQHYGDWNREQDIGPEDSFLIHKEEAGKLTPANL